MSGEPFVGGAGTSRARLVWFDLTRGFPTALRALAACLGWRAVLRLAPAFLWRSLTADPFSALAQSRPPDRRERLARHQLRPVLLLDGVLRDVLGLDAASSLAVLGEVVARVGARFLAASFAALTPARWATLGGAGRGALVRRLVGRLFNVEGAVVASGDTHFAFEVTACLFVSLTRALGRPELAPLYCTADAAYFEAPAAGIALARRGTLARGAPCCDFRFTLRPVGGGPRV
ncbi:MAG TPA: L-2-amino-thiazoline-4-carboxylic acid hydrolase [Myxococcota bacterium]|nr:L-2-amino-thiazoline-4-carboxylic acid hydrolase [Myxococcota bacterium]